MSPRFTVDLASPGRAQRSRWDWFLGPDGPRRLAILAVAGIVLVLLIGVGGLLPRYWRYSSELQTIAKLRVDAAAADKELSTLQASLRDLDAGALRQVRWAEILPALSKSLPGTLRIDRVTLGKGLRQGPPGTAAAANAKPDAKPGDAKSGDLMLQIDASTTMVSGGSRLVDIANFMAAVAADPAVSRRFQLKTWDIQRPQQSGEEQLRISIALAEKRS
jgi:hypothetical protein